MKKKVLIVDDEKNIRLTLKTALTEAGYQVETAVNGEDGLDKVNEDDYPVILLDINMPGMNGIQFLKEINDLDINSAVVMITGYGSIDTAVETLKLGAVDYLRKPFKPEEIIEVVEDIFKRYNRVYNKNKDSGFEDYISQAKNEIKDNDLFLAKNLLKKAISNDFEKPQSFNLLGIIFELQQKQGKAMKMYRAALALDPAYKPAIDNIERAGESMGVIDLDSVNLGEEEEDK